MKRKRYLLRDVLRIRKLITFYYREMPKTFRSGESHDFWEFVYLDKGEVDITIGDEMHYASQGDIVFIKPDVFHGIRPRNGSAPNLIILSFDCSDPCMSFFSNKLFRLNAEEKSILTQLMQEGLHAFEPSIDSPTNHLLTGREDAPFGCEQLIANYVEILLILMYRERMKPNIVHPSTNNAQEGTDNEIIADIIQYLKNHLSDNLTYNEVCNKFAISPTKLKMLFKAHTGTGMITYFNRLKINHAKWLIRKKSYSFSEISDMLGYSSLNYFSKQFKKTTDMTPTAYSRAIEARISRKLLPAHSDKI